MANTIWLLKFPQDKLFRRVTSKKLFSFFPELELFFSHFVIKKMAFSVIRQDTGKSGTIIIIRKTW